MLYTELQPVDSFRVKLTHPFSAYDRQMITLFYQPLIGSEAVSLFLTLWTDAENQEPQEHSHYYLMNVLSFPLQRIFQARISLEAIGLLRTYKKRDENEARSFLYELLPPLDAPSYFNDPLLSTFLFSKIGEKPYRQLRSRFLAETIEEQEYTDISRTFLDVFQPARGDQQAVEITAGSQFKGKTTADGIPFQQYDFNFELFYAGLSEQMMPRTSLRSISQEMIAKLAFLYSLNPLDMQSVVMMSMDDNHTVSEERLKRAASEFYKMNRSKKPPKLQTSFITTKSKESSKSAMSKEEEYLHYLENISPKEMLRDMNNGKEPFEVDLKLAETLIITHELPVGVVNVLFQYLKIRNDGKITKGYAERIASHWASKGVLDAKTAMRLSREEHDQYLAWKTEGKKTSNRKQKTTREEQVPEWFSKRSENKKNPEVPADFDVEEERRKLMKELGIEENEVK
ncbi:MULTISPECIES: replication initiation and membrane attachment family protein [Sporosarcina]|uniref:replication initiation and membrane attachment family protein n=1 Tax=Sporosarcina TaxID=1569 RepID=UPI00129C06EB|nr:MULTISPECIES: DnaD domain protein [Sporosarcina]GKV66871.1 replication initiation and membrane attachment protein [Sporosarcina sp. NCCP-2331]GLB57166.1 replication initiation and membrane attachment protein [Sporosarcina sp. NCCP-2378]